MKRNNWDLQNVVYTIMCFHVVRIQEELKTDYDKEPINDKYKLLQIKK